jgi:hypothetical protein
MQEGVHVPISRLDLRVGWATARHPARVRLSWPGQGRLRSRSDVHGRKARPGIRDQKGDGAEATGDDAMPDYFGPQWRLLSTVEQVFEFNWKIFVDGLLEGYHIRSTHPQTFYPRQYDNTNVVEFYGRNTRVSYPYRVIEKLRDAPAEERRATGVMTQLNHLFPNVSIATFPTHMTMAVIEPLAVDKTRLVTYFLSDRPDDEAIKKARDFVTAGTAEDRDMGLAIQRGLASGANRTFTFGLFEGGSRHFHRNLAAAMETM